MVNKMKSQSGFSLVAVLSAVLLVSVIGFAAYRITGSNDSELSKNDSSTPKTVEEAAGNRDCDIKNYEINHTGAGADSLLFSVPNNWCAKKNYFGDHADYSGTYYSILSPDYKDDMSAQYYINSGGIIDIGILDDVDSQDIDQHFSNVKNGGGYIDNIEKTKVNGVEAVKYDAGHTTDGVVYEFLTRNGKVASISFSTKNITGEYGDYSSSEHFDTFKEFLNSFVEYNFKPKGS